jgi:hypothetical protein
MRSLKAPIIIDQERNETTTEYLRRREREGNIGRPDPGHDEALRAFVPGFLFISALVCTFILMGCLV